VHHLRRGILDPDIGQFADHGRQSAVQHAFASTGTSAAKTIYAYPVNSAGQGPTGGMAAIGSWTIPTPPIVVSLTPATGQGSSQTFALTVSDLAGASDLASVQILFANSTSLSSACAVTYVAQQKNIGLSNDAGTGYTGYVTPGQAGSVSNSQCTLSGAGSSIQSGGNALVLTVSLQFNVAFASLGTSAAKTIYANPVNSAGQGPSGGMVSSGPGQFQRRACQLSCPYLPHPDMARPKRSL